jgi:uncharacterized protein with HEPN domain
MNARDRARLEHMLEAARRATEFVQGRTRADLDRDNLLADAIMWRIAVIGETAAHVSEETCVTMPMLPWTDGVGVRDRRTRSPSVRQGDGIFRALPALRAV